MKAKIILWLKTLWIKSKKTIIYLSLVLALLSVAYVLGRCSTREQRLNQINNIVAARDSIKRSYVIIDGLKNSIWEKNAIILSEIQAKEAGLLEIERLKKLHFKEVITNTELTATVHRQDSMLKLPPNTVYITVKDSSGVMHDYIQVPFVLLNEHDKYISLDAGIDSTKSPYYKLGIPFAGSVTIGYVKTGFLKSAPRGIFITENPFITVNNMEVLIVREDKKWYQLWWVHALAGAATFETARYFITK